MLDHYSHVRMAAKRTAVEALGGGLIVPQANIQDVKDRANWNSSVQNPFAAWRKSSFRATFARAGSDQRWMSRYRQPSGSWSFSALSNDLIASLGNSAAVAVSRRRLSMPPL
jgi:hypothetical protein